MDSMLKLIAGIVIPVQRICEMMHCKSFMFEGKIEEWVVSWISVAAERCFIDAGVVETLTKMRHLSTP